MVPQPLQQHVEEFKKFVKEERAVSSDIAHVSAKAHAQIRDAAAVQRDKGCSSYSLLSDPGEGEREEGGDSKNITSSST